MTPRITISGPHDELVGLRSDLLRSYPGDLEISQLNSPHDGLFDRGRLGESPIVSYLIEFAAGVSATGATALIASIKTKISKSKNVQIKVSDAEPPKEQGADA